VAREQLRLAVFDIDGTLRRVRDPWIHLHESLGVAELAAGFIERWRRGEISYEDWARLDASLWRGFPRQTILAALETNHYRRGARELTAWLTSRPIPCVGISTGLSVFNEQTARELGIQEVISNELHFERGICSGEVSIRVSEDAKGEVMERLLGRLGISSRQAVAFGDGTADIPLLSRAGLGIAVCPAHERVRECAAQVVESEPIDQAIALVERHFLVSPGSP
jgi:phosphoserine phosphatase